MIYRVKLDGFDMYGSDPETTILSPTLNIELNSAGSLEFKMPVYHKYYDYPQLMVSDAEVYENDELIWFGRVLEIKTALNKEKSIYCEGPLAYFNDSIQRPDIFDETTVHEFFQTVIERHNAQVPANRQFTVGEITVDNTSIYRKLDYETTKDVLERMCLNAEGGYFVFRKVEGVNYIDWLSELSIAANQPIQFALNIVDISQLLTGEDICTAILPLGKAIDGVKVTIADVHGGIDYLESEAAATYGRITRVVEFPDIQVDTELLTAAEKWLTNNQFDPLSIECDAAELHYLDGSYYPFMTGQVVHVQSNPHLIDRNFPLTKIQIAMDSAVKKITVGTQKKRELTEIYKNE